MTNLRSLILIATVLARSTYTQQYTRWNLVLLFLHRTLGIPIQSIFLSSVCTLVGFQHGGTDGTKRRLMARCHVTSPLLFLTTDFLGHVCPVLLSGLLMCRPRLLISPSHLVQVYTWVGLYYTLVGGGFNCEKQYGVYPWKRQVRAAAIVPLVVWVAWNRDARQNSWVRSLLSGVLTFYIKEWYDLIDSHDKGPLHMHGRKNRSVGPVVD